MSSGVAGSIPKPGHHVAILVPTDPDAPVGPIALDRPVCVVGDRSRVHLVLSSPLISRAHALLVDDGDELYVRDLCSRNGVRINGNSVREAAIRDDDRLKIGPFTFHCRIISPHREPSSEPTSALIRPEGGNTVRLNVRRTTILGSRSGCDVRVNGIGVSPVHAVIFRRLGRWFIRDLGSEGGTRVYGRLIREAELLGGEQIRVGTAAVWYMLDDSPEQESWRAADAFDAPEATAAELGLDNLATGPGASASHLHLEDLDQTALELPRPQGFTRARPTSQQPLIVPAPLPDDPPIEEPSAALPIADELPPELTADDRDLLADLLDEASPEPEEPTAETTETHELEAEIVDGPAGAVHETQVFEADVIPFPTPDEATAEEAEPATDEASVFDSESGDPIPLASSEEEQVAFEEPAAASGTKVEEEKRDEPAEVQEEAVEDELTVRPPPVWPADPDRHPVDIEQELLGEAMNAQSRGLPEPATLLGIEAMLDGMGLGDDMAARGPLSLEREGPTPPELQASHETQPIPLDDQAHSEPEQPPAQPFHPITPVAIGWARCPCCGTSFPLDGHTTSLD